MIPRNPHFTLLLVLMAWFWSAAQSPNHPGLRVEGRHLYDRCGEKVIGIGVNEMSIWDGNNHTGTGYLSEVEKTGANMIRLVWMPTGTAANLDKLIENTLAAKMIPMPELHGATGDLSNLDSQVDYWVRPDVVAVIQKYERDVLVNIANESGAHSVTNQQFLDAYKTAITRMRNAGYRVPLVIDAPAWGQNINVLQATWQELTNHDPHNNLLFSVHTWWISSSDGSRARVTQELQETVDIGMPLIIGEFAPMGVGCGRYFDYRHMMAEAHKHEIGWLAWSWGKVANGDCAEMGMTSNGVFGNWRNTPNDSTWGEVVAVSDVNSIRNRAVRPHSIVHGTCANADGPFSLQTTVVGPGSVSASPQAATYAKGSTVTLTATPQAGMDFVEWSGDASGTTTTLQVSMDRDRRVTATFRDPSAVVNLVRNGDFSGGANEWELGQWGGAATLSTAAGTGSIGVTDAGSEVWHVQLLQSGLALQAGLTYTLSFRASAQTAVSIPIAVGQSATPYEKYLTQQVALTSAPTVFTYTFTPAVSDPDARLEFNFGGLGVNTYTLDDISLVQGGNAPVTRDLPALHNLKHQAGPRLLFRDGRLWLAPGAGRNPVDLRGRVVDVVPVQTGLRK